MNKQTNDMAQTASVFTGIPDTENYKNDPLWERLQTFNPDDPDAVFPFSAKLAKQNNWNKVFALMAIEEYKRFIYLCCTLPQGASPPPVIDEVWHLHLNYTVNYWEFFCEKILQNRLHHHPSKGGMDEDEKHHIWLDDTLKNYRNVFGEEPPGSIWNPALIRGYKSPLSKFKTFVAAVIVLTGCFLIGGCTGTRPFLGMIGVFLFLAILSSNLSRHKRNNSNVSDGGSSCSSGDCGSSCGGDGGGGGCGGCGGD